jgi:16S rRNA (adenine1518-N6/adenine1519-N6)-dimethyltransferase
VSSGTPPDARALLKEYGLSPKKRLGQCFLIDRRIVRAIAETAAAGADTVIEIGAGLGALTIALTDLSVRVVAIERDRDLIPILEKLRADRPNLEIVQADATQVALASLSQTPRPHIAGNLPYSVTSPLLLALLAQRETIGPATVMVQREVADRLAAPPGGRDYGSLSVLFQLYAELERVMLVPASAFHPVPAVDSAVLRLEWRTELAAPVADSAFFERVVRAAFSQRRKTLRNSLSTGFSKDAVRSAAAVAEIDLDRRAETLSIAEFARLAQALTDGRA